MTEDQPKPRLTTMPLPAPMRGWTREYVVLDGQRIGILTTEEYKSDGGGTAHRYYPTTTDYRPAGVQKAYLDRPSAVDAIVRAHRSATPGGRR